MNVLYQYQRDCGELRFVLHKDLALPRTRALRTWIEELKWLLTSAKTFSKIEWVAAAANGTVGLLLAYSLELCLQDSQVTHP